MSNFSEKEIMSYMLVTLTQVIDLLRKHVDNYMNQNLYYIDGNAMGIQNMAQHQTVTSTNQQMNVQNQKASNEPKGGRKSTKVYNSMPSL